MRPARFLWVLSVVILAVAGCGSNPVTACTALGCFSGLRLTFDRQPDAETVITIEVDVGGIPWVVRCGVDTDCSTGLSLPDFFPESARVRITSPAGDVVVHEIEPEYEETQPNGPDCPPVCVFATVGLELPS